MDFICLLGPGDFTGTFTIAAPDSANAGPRCDLTTLNSDFHRYNPESQLREYHRDPESVLRMFAFGVTFRGDFVGWDTRHVTSSRPREYRVLLLSRAAEETDVIAETFEEFVNDWCLGNKYLRLSPEEQEDPEWAKRVYKAAYYL
ncbi:MAG: hypothetical protein IT428_24365 [Planctomycetaceae bacterium]|nr:hypothetical protein [Planctomycetaceae bacterium]